MDELIAKLNELYARPLSGDPLDNGWYEGEDESDTLVEDITGLAMKLLHVREDGSIHRNMENVHHLKAAGYDNYREESDSYGWLTGCIQKIGDHRVVHYG